MLRHQNYRLDKTANLFLPRKRQTTNYFTQASFCFIIFNLCERRQAKLFAPLKNIR